MSGVVGVGENEDDADPLVEADDDVDPLVEE